MPLFFQHAANITTPPCFAVLFLRPCRRHAADVSAAYAAMPLADDDFFVCDADTPMRFIFITLAASFDMLPFAILRRAMMLAMPAAAAMPPLAAPADAAMARYAAMPHFDDAALPRRRAAARCRRYTAMQLALFRQMLIIRRDACATPPRCRCLL